jgi:hypothetical protein
MALRPLAHAFQYEDSSILTPATHHTLHLNTLTAHQPAPALYYASDNLSSNQLNSTSPRSFNNKLPLLFTKQLRNIVSRPPSFSTFDLPFSRNFSH